MKPMRNCLFESWGTGGRTEGVGGEDGVRNEASRRVARFRTLTRSGRSVDD
jgi:hypothetical protein